MVFAESLSTAYNFVNAVTENGKKYETSILNIHGATEPEESHLGGTIYPSKNASIMFEQKLSISYWDIQQYLSNSPELLPADKTEIQGIVNFMTLTMENFVLYACGAANSTELASQIQSLMISTNQNLIVYMNGDLTSTYTNDEKKIQLNGPLTLKATIMNKRSQGWKRITKENIVRLKTLEGYTGNLKIRNDVSPAIYEEKKR